MNTWSAIFVGLLAAVLLASTSSQIRYDHQPTPRKIRSDFDAGSVISSADRIAGNFFLTQIAPSLNLGIQPFGGDSREDYNNGNYYHYNNYNYENYNLANDNYNARNKDSFNNQIAAVELKPNIQPSPEQLDAGYSVNRVSSGGQVTYSYPGQIRTGYNSHESSHYDTFENSHTNYNPIGNSNQNVNPPGNSNSNLNTFSNSNSNFGQVQNSNSNFGQVQNSNSNFNSFSNSNTNFVQVQNSNAFNPAGQTNTNLNSNSNNDFNEDSLPPLLFPAPSGSNNPADPDLDLRRRFPQPPSAKVVIPEEPLPNGYEIRHATRHIYAIKRRRINTPSPQPPTKVKYLETYLQPEYGSPVVFDKGVFPAESHYLQTLHDPYSHSHVKFHHKVPALPPVFIHKEKIISIPAPRKVSQPVHNFGAHLTEGYVVLGPNVTIPLNSNNVSIYQPERNNEQNFSRTGASTLARLFNLLEQRDQNMKFQAQPQIQDYQQAQREKSIFVSHIQSWTRLKHNESTPNLDLDFGGFRFEFSDRKSLENILAQANNQSGVTVPEEPQSSNGEDKALNWFKDIYTFSQNVHNIVHEDGRKKAAGLFYKDRYLIPGGPATAYGPPKAADPEVSQVAVPITVTQVKGDF